MKWPWRNRETRSGAGSGGSYSDAVVAAVLATAGGRTLGIPGGTAAVEMASGIVQRAFQAAELADCTEEVKQAADASFRGLVGREMVRRGEAVFLIETKGGRLRLFPATTWTVFGGYDPENWLYEITLSGPSKTFTVKAPATAVVHIRYAADASRPWDGQGPLQSASTAARLAGNLSGALADEAGASRGYLLPMQKTGGQDENVDNLKADLAKLNGEVTLVESQAGGFDTSGAASGQDWKQQRIGADPPEELVRLHEVSTREMLNAFGLSAAIFSESQGTASREGWRQCLHGVLMPLAKCAAEELAMKLESPGLRFDFHTLAASDISGRARAFQSLVKSGMAAADAAAHAGLME